ncbi:MAG TPA: ABC transporter ATP-binding protein [Verrucomicrobiales bacterium]|nr:ABC transporter ATP-binding protein [Verrucomicrobiales bacterium]
MSTPNRQEKKRISASEFMVAARGPYRRLLSFLKPYKKRFILGLLCGAIYGGLNGVLVFAVNHVFKQVLPGEEITGRNSTTIAESWHAKRELPELRESLASLPEAPREAAVQSYAKLREELHDRSLHPLKEDEPDPLASFKPDPNLPDEFRLCLEGERALLSKGVNDVALAGKFPGTYPEHIEEARSHWQKVLELPEAQRRHRTLWARYLLAYTESNKTGKAEQLTALQKDSETGKFTDVLELAQVAPKPPPLSKIILLCLAIPAMMLTRAIFGFLNSYCLTWVSLRVLNDIRGKLFQRILGQSMEFFNKQKAGDLMQTILHQTRTAQESLSQVAGDIIKEPVSIIGALAALFYIDPKFTLMAFILFPLLIVPVTLVGKRVRRLAGAEEREAGNMSVIMQEALIGVREVKAYNRESYETERFRKSNWRMLSNMQKWRKMMEAVGPSVEVMASFGVAGALLYVYSLEMPAAQFIALNGGLVLLYPPAKALSRIPVMLQRCLVATTSVFNLMDREVTVKDAVDAKPLPGPATGRVSFENATFAYTQDSPALRGMTLDIAPHESVSFVGRSGAGKSTVFSLLLRLYDPQDGRILLDGHDIRGLTQESLRSQIGVVSQDVFLFHDTIYENIRYGRLDATEEEIHEAAQRAHAHDFILAQANGYQTVIGDKGSLLSGGQRQRISIARAFLKNAPILLLDEATSALDTEAERHVQEAITDLAEGKTVLAIAHRLSTVIRSDKIVVMQDGCVTAIGRHEELLKTSELYRTLYRMQFGTVE